MRDVGLESNQPNPYQPEICWMGIGDNKYWRIHGVPGCPLYDVAKPLGSFRSYLCNEHVNELVKMGYTVTKVTETRRTDEK